MFWCDGGMGCHYGYGKPGSGAFRGAFVNARYLLPEERQDAAAGAGEDKSDD